MPAVPDNCHHSAWSESAMDCISAALEAVTPAIIVTVLTKTDLLARSPGPGHQLKTHTRSQLLHICHIPAYYQGYDINIL